MTATHLKPINTKICKHPSLTQTLGHMLGVMRGVSEEMWKTPHIVIGPTNTHTYVILEIKI